MPINIDFAELNNFAVGTGEPVTITEVFTGATLGKVPTATLVEVEEAFITARKVQEKWAKVTLHSRAKIFQRLAKLAFENRKDLLDVIQAETGKSRFSALEEVLDVMLTSRFYANKAPKWLKEKRIPGMLPVLTQTSVNHRPLGVVGIISPWNYPLTLTLSDAIPALLAGNAVILKPDSQTPYSALLAAKLLAAVGLPDGVFQVLPGSGRTVGAALADHSDYLMFTGSTTTGKILGSQVGERLVGYSAELGGKNPMIVATGADLDKAVEVAMRAMFSNTGQLCISIERVYVTEDIYPEFKEKLRLRTAQLIIGAGYRFGIDVGSLISAKQLETVQEHVADAVAKGAQILIGGKARPDLGPYFYEPTILTEVPETAICYAEETFGPVVSLYPVKDLAAAIAAANDTRFGLNASVFAANARLGKEIAKEINAGTVNVNEGYAAAFSSLAGPMGGMGESGIGRRHGQVGLLKYTQAQTVAVQRLLDLSTPEFLDQKKWANILIKATNLLRFMPGR